jgi:hypothetical protein
MNVAAERRALPVARLDPGGALGRQGEHWSRVRGPRLWALSGIEGCSIKRLLSTD